MAQRIQRENQWINWLGQMQLNWPRNQLANDILQDLHEDWNPGHYDFNDFSVDLATNQIHVRNNEGSYDIRSFPNPRIQQMQLNRPRQLNWPRNELANDVLQDRHEDWNPGHYDFNDFSVDLATNQIHARNNEGSYDIRSFPNQTILQMQLNRQRNQLANDIFQDQHEDWNPGHYHFNDFTVDLALIQPQERNNEGPYEAETNFQDSLRCSSPLHELLNEFSLSGGENVPQLAYDLAVRRTKEATAMEAAAIKQAVESLAANLATVNLTGVNLPMAIHGPFPAGDFSKIVRIVKLSKVLKILYGMQLSDLRTVEERISRLLNQHYNRCNGEAGGSGDQVTHDQNSAPRRADPRQETRTNRWFVANFLEWTDFVLKGILIGLLEVSRP